jgi:predicted membrane-bound spermidine synthase
MAAKDRAQERVAVRWSVAVPMVFAFVGSGCLLVLELVAGRLLAPTLGVSLYTWTSVIGVVLAGVSLGNFVGGRLADRSPSGRMQIQQSVSDVSNPRVLYYLGKAKPVGRRMRRTAAADR